jgi:hypothetical protein
MKFRSLHPRIIAVNTNDHHIFSVKTSFAKQDYVKITVSFSTHSVDYEKVQMVSEQIEEFSKDLIVDWSQIKV